MRRIDAVRRDLGEVLVCLPNHHRRGASTSAALGKERWQIAMLRLGYLHLSSRAAEAWPVWWPFCA